MTKKHGVSLLAVSFKGGFTSPNIPIATFYQGDKEIIFLLDSGSDRNVINEDALKLFDHTLKEKDASSVTHLSGVGGSQEVETCTMSFGTEDSKYTTDFLVTDLSPAFDGIRKEHCIQIHGILGSTFLKEHHIILDYKNLSAYSVE